MSSEIKDQWNLIQDRNVEGSLSPFPIDIGSDDQTTISRSSMGENGEESAFENISYSILEDDILSNTSGSDESMDMRSLAGRSLSARNEMDKTKPHHKMGQYKNITNNSSNNNNGNADSFNSNTLLSSAINNIDKSNETLHGSNIQGHADIKGTQQQYNGDVGKNNKNSAVNLILGKNTDSHPLYNLEGFDIKSTEDENIRGEKKNIRGEKKNFNKKSVMSPQYKNDAFGESIQMKVKSISPLSESSTNIISNTPDNSNENNTKDKKADGHNHVHENDEDSILIGNGIKFLIVFCVFIGMTFCFFDHYQIVSKDEKMLIESLKPFEFKFLSLNDTIDKAKFRTILMIDNDDSKDIQMLAKGKGTSVVHELFNDGEYIINFNSSEIYPIEDKIIYELGKRTINEKLVRSINHFQARLNRTMNSLDTLFKDKIHHCPINTVGRETKIGEFINSMKLCKIARESARGEGVLYERYLNRIERNAKYISSKLQGKLRESTRYISDNGNDNENGNASQETYK